MADVPATPMMCKSDASRIQPVRGPNRWSVVAICRLFGSARPGGIRDARDATLVEEPADDGDVFDVRDGQLPRVVAEDLTCAPVMLPHSPLNPT